MEEPSLKTSRQAIALAIAVSLLLGGIGFLAGRTTAPAPDSPPEEPVETIVPPVDLFAGTMVRADLLRLASSAADATGAGEPLPGDLRPSAGRRFELRLPFGCEGPAANNASHGWTYDERSGRLRVFANPESWGGGYWNAPDGAAVEGIDGFWIARPWTSSDACPPAPATPARLDTESGESGDAGAETEAGNGLTPGAEPSAPARTLAIGQVRTAESGRGGQRAWALFETVTRVSAGELNTSQGFRLRLMGRLTNGMGIAPVTCRAEDPAASPRCLITAAIDEVAIENPATGQILATWNLGQREAVSVN